MSDKSPRLDLPYIQSAQAQKHVTHNEALRILDVLVQLSVVAFDATTPPTLPVEGDTYAIGAGAIGGWLGHDFELAQFVDGYWQYFSPQAGWLSTLVGSTEVRIWTGTSWDPVGIGTLDNLEGVGINTTHDLTNRLAVSAPATLFSHEGAGHQLKVNKASVGDTASLLFQDNWSGRAEMGLAGDDNFHVKVSADGTAWTEALSIDAETGAVTIVQGAMAGLELSAISGLTAGLAIDVQVYDTSLDSDGGAWRQRFRNTSWYRETLNTASRGARAEFPAVAVIVAEANKVTIYDGDDPALPMWKVIDFTGYTIASIAARNGVVAVGLTASGVALIDFPVDALAPAPRYTTASTPAIASNAVSGVAIAALPGAPVSTTTGLPILTLAAATAGGVSVIKSDGTTASSAAIGAAYRCGIIGTSLQYQQSGVGQFCTRDLGSITAGWIPTTILTSTSTPATKQAVAPGSKLTLGAAGGAAGLTLINENASTPAKSMVAYVTSTFGSGWMQGDIRGAWLASTDPVSLVGGTDADRSVNATPINVNGTITRAPVATGAELVAYSGFSSSNYLEQPYNAGLDFGTGDFCVMGWVKAAAQTSFILERADTGYAARLSLYRSSAGSIAVLVNATSLAFGADLDNTWQHLVIVRESGTLRGYLNGALKAAVAATGNISNPTAVTRLGVSRTATYPLNGALAFWRVSATAPTADQVRHIYETEKALFQPDAQCTLHGTSDAVTALAHDPVTGLLHVGTSAGRSDFQGLVRVANTTTAVTTALSAAGGLISEQ